MTPSNSCLNRKRKIAIIKAEALVAVRAAAVQVPVKIEKPLAVLVVTIQAQEPMLRIIKIIRSPRISVVVVMPVIYRVAAESSRMLVAKARAVPSKMLIPEATRTLVVKAKVNKSQESSNV